MKRREFIEREGATCANWNWSWSFVNHAKRQVIFGAWESFADEEGELVLSDDWQVSSKGRRQPGYSQAREHISLIEEKGYQLKTFLMIYSDEMKGADGEGPAKIKDFVPVLNSRTLKRVGKRWYAMGSGEEVPILPEEVEKPEDYFEGASRSISVNTYERNGVARAKCLAHYGFKCTACAFDFQERYGNLGARYIHVHHLTPIGRIKKEYKLDPIRDLRPICPNCHAMIHRTKTALTIEELKLALRE